MNPTNVYRKVTQANANMHSNINAGLSRALHLMLNPLSIRGSPSELSFTMLQVYKVADEEDR